MRGILSAAVKSMFGTVGLASFDVDILDWDATSHLALITVSGGNNGLVAVRSALTVMSAYETNKLRITVVQASPFLLSLANCSREQAIN